MEESLDAHSALSLEIIGCSFVSVFEGSRRARACTLEMEERERRVVRMCEPCVVLSACVPSHCIVWDWGAYHKACTSYNCC